MRGVTTQLTKPLPRQPPDAEELHTKAVLAVEIVRAIEARSLSQVAAAKILGVTQPKVSALKAFKSTHGAASAVDPRCGRNYPPARRTGAPCFIFATASASCARSFTSVNREAPCPRPRTSTSGTYSTPISRPSS